MAFIIAPANNVKSLVSVLDAGADMVYTGLSGFCRKERESADIETIAVMARLAGERCKKVIAALNRMPLVGQDEDFIDAVEKLIEVGVGGAVLNDAGLIKKVKESFPGFYVMASIGLSPLNFYEVDFLKEAGADTILLSEFLSPAEIIEIKKKTGAGLELFASGLREFGYTGKCILSSYYHQTLKEGRYIGSAKRGGACADVCRKSFRCGGCNGERKLPLYRYSIDESFDEVFELIDVFKIWRGALKTEELSAIIRSFAERLHNGV